MERKPRGSSMISTGITGTARHGTTPNSASRMRVKTLLSTAPPRAQDRLARARHVRRIDVVADHLQREIGLHAGAHVEGAVVEQRPAAMRALDAAQIDGDLALRARRRPARRDSGAAARIRPGWWRRPRARTPNGRRAAGSASSASRRRRDRCARARRASRSRGLQSWSTSIVASVASCEAARASACASPARDRRRGCRSGSHPRWWPASPVAVQSPASNRLRQRGARAGPQRVLLRRRREGRAPLAHDLPRRQVAPAMPAIAATSRQIVARELLARHVDQPVGGADGDRQPVREGEQPFDGAADHAE